MELECYDVERRRDGVILVRVHSPEKNGRRLPDAVFTFRRGDPQYEYWEERLNQARSA
ncbi:MAG: hypothetical protein KJZ87_08320 [Thermoguttaceae bacterium]|nr:hypothetical protein [Thermoguttaceae bacterium]